jgi:hypothetical protein
MPLCEPLTHLFCFDVITLANHKHMPLCEPLTDLFCFDVITLKIPSEEAEEKAAQRSSIYPTRVPQIDHQTWGDAKGAHWLASRAWCLLFCVGIVI